MLRLLCLCVPVVFRVLRFCSLWEEVPSVSVAVRCMPLLQRIAGKKEAEGEKQGLQEQERFFFFLEQRSF